MVFEDWIDKSEFDQFFGAKAVFGSQTLLNQLSYVKIVGL